MRTRELKHSGKLEPALRADYKWPMYLKGFKPGKLAPALSLLDELGNPINNVYNNTAKSHYLYLFPTAKTL